MRESESSGGVLERYEVPAMRVVPTACGRIVSESFIGDTSQNGVFSGGGSFGWDGGPVEGDLNGIGQFSGVGSGWDGIEGDFNELGQFSGGAGSGWDGGPVEGDFNELGLFGGGTSGWDGIEGDFNGPSLFGGGVGSGWDGGPVDGGLDLGVFTGNGSGWNGGASNGGMDGFTGGAPIGWTGDE